MEGITTGEVVRQLSMGASTTESSWEVSMSAVPFMAGLEERERAALCPWSGSA
jgi:hypothetical protein